MSTSGLQLTKYLAPRLPDFRGCYSKDRLPTQRLTGSYIVNLQNFDDGDGTHWVCFVQQKNQAVYIDSFGGPPPLAVRAFTWGPVFYSTAVIQGINSENCGRFCAFALLMLADGRTITQIAKCFTSDPDLNDRIVRRAVRI